MGELDGWKHCPRCAAAVEPEQGRLECARCGFVTYACSKPTASAVVVGEGGAVLLSKRAHEPFAGKWDLPGGFLEEGEHPLDCLRRELREEAGIGIAGERFLGSWIDRYGHEERAVWTLNLYWCVRIAEGTPVPADDVAELRWFQPQELPVDQLAFGHIEEVLSAWRDQDAEPSRLDGEARG